MKNLITTIASVMIMMVFLLQFINNQVLHNKIMNIDRSVNCFKEIAKQEGRLSDIREEELKTMISKYVDCDESEIAVMADDKVRGRGEVINLKVEIPLKNLIAANEVFGIDDDSNSGIYCCNLYTTSEYVAR